MNDKSLNSFTRVKAFFRISILVLLFYNDLHFFQLFQIVSFV